MCEKYKTNDKDCFINNFLLRFDTLTLKTVCQCTVIKTFKKCKYKLRSGTLVVLFYVKNMKTTTTKK